MRIEPILRSALPLRTAAGTLAALVVLAATACSRSDAPQPKSGTLIIPKQGQNALMSPIFTEGFESGLGSWVAATSSGSCTWHTPNHPETLHINTGPDARCAG